MTTFTIVVVKIVGHNGLRVGWVGKHGLVAQFGFEALPQTLGLRIVLAVAPAAVREPGFDGAQQGLIYLVHVLAAPVSVDHQAKSGPLDELAPLQSVSSQCFWCVSSHLQADHLLGDTS